MTTCEKTVVQLIKDKMMAYLHKKEEGRLTADTGQLGIRFINNKYIIYFTCCPGIQNAVNILDKISELEELCTVKAHVERAPHYKKAGMYNVADVEIALPSTKKDLDYILGVLRLKGL